MERWLDKVKSTLGGNTDPYAQSRRVLRLAQRSRIQLMLELENQDSEDSRKLTANIEQIAEDSFIISQPTAGVMGHPLNKRETIQFTLVVQGKRYQGVTRCAGRARIPSGGKRMLYGYRLNLPEQLDTPERRSDPRTTVGYDLAPKAVLKMPDHTEEITGIVIDISASGVQVRSYQAEGLFKVGDNCHFQTELPTPVGTLSAPVRVAFVSPGKVDGQTILGLAFHQRLDRVAQFVRCTENRRARRRTG